MMATNLSCKHVSRRICISTYLIDFLVLSFPRLLFNFYAIFCFQTAFKIHNTKRKEKHEFSAVIGFVGSVML